MTEAAARRVLLVEDDAAVAEVIRRVLVHRACHVIVVPNAAAAMRQLDSMYFDFVLADFDLDEQADGLDVLRHARRACRNATRLLFSGFPNNAAIDAALSDGSIHEFLPKPLTLGAIERILERR